MGGKSLRNCKDLNLLNQKIFGRKLAKKVSNGDKQHSVGRSKANPYELINIQSDTESVEHSTVDVRLLQRRHVSSGGRSDSRYAILFVTFGDKAGLHIKKSLLR